MKNSCYYSKSSLTAKELLDYLTLLSNTNDLTTITVGDNAIHFTSLEFDNKSKELSIFKY